MKFYHLIFYLFNNLIYLFKPFSNIKKNISVSQNLLNIILIFQKLDCQQFYEKISTQPILKFISTKLKISCEFFILKYLIPFFILKIEFIFTLHIKN